MQTLPSLALVAGSLLVACGASEAPPAEPAQPTAAPEASAAPTADASTSAAAAPPAAPAGDPKVDAVRQKLADQVTVFTFVTGSVPKQKGLCFEVYGSKDQAAAFDKGRPASEALARKEFKFKPSDKLGKACPSDGVVPGRCINGFGIGVHYDAKAFTVDTAKAHCKDHQDGVWLD